MSTNESQRMLQGITNAIHDSAVREYKRARLTLIQREQRRESDAEVRRALIEVGIEVRP
jgi:hypothetical protein